MTNQVIPEAAVEAAAKAVFDAAKIDVGWSTIPGAHRDGFLHDASVALEAAAPHLLARVTALADAWEARGEHDMKVAKTIDDDYIASELLGHGAQMVEDARHIRNAIGVTT